MPGFLLHEGATAKCPHGGQLSIYSTNKRVLVNGQPVVTLSDTYTVVGCAFAVGPKPQPCVKVEWSSPATRVFVGGQPVILQTSVGVSKSAEQIPQGPPVVGVTQTKVSGT